MTQFKSDQIRQNINILADVEQDLPHWQALQLKPQITDKLYQASANNLASHLPRRRLDIWQEKKAVLSPITLTFTLAGRHWSRRLLMGIVSL